VRTALLEQESSSRVPELVPIRYGRMLSAPFAFFRGAASIMAHDLAEAPRTALTVQLCGDADLPNFGPSDGCCSTSTIRHAAEALGASWSSRSSAWCLLDWLRNAGGWPV
jgi:hypothetical protein